MNVKPVTLRQLLIKLLAALRTFFGALGFLANGLLAKSADFAWKQFQAVSK
jgi:hypothetical protein